MGEGVFFFGVCVGKLIEDMCQFVEEVRDVVIFVFEIGEFIFVDDYDRCFFEVVWMYKYNGKYYFFYFIGDIYYFVYGVGDSFYGFFIYGGRILELVLGWIIYYFIVEFKGWWWLFYYDCEFSKGVDYLWFVKVKEIFYDKDGKIVIEKFE